MRLTNLHKIFLVCFGVTVALILSEIATRIYYYKQFSSNAMRLLDDAVVYAHRPSIKFTNNYGVYVEYNSLGFIGKEIEPKSENVFRIFGIGDSITAAEYLTEGERYLNRLEVILTEKTGRAVEVINGGVGGYSTQQELELLRTKGLLLDPDLIVVGVCLNDFYIKRSNLTKGLFGRILENYRDGSRARCFDFIYQRSDLYKFIYDFLSETKRGRLGDKSYQRYLEEYEYTIKPRDFEKWKKAFLKMLSLARLNDTNIVFVIFPLRNQIIKGEDNFSFVLLSDFFEENSIYYIDLIECFKRYAAKEHLLYRKRDIIHPSALGHKIAGEVIADYILKNKLMSRHYEHF